MLVLSRKKGLYLPLGTLTSRESGAQSCVLSLTEKRKERSCVGQESVFISPGFLEGKQISL